MGNTNVHESMDVSAPSTSSSTISPTNTGEASTSGNNLPIIPMGTEDTSARCPFKKPTSTSSSTISPTKTGEASTSGNNLPIIPMGTEDTSARCPFKKPTSTSSSTISPTKTGEASTSGNNLSIIPMGTEDTSARCPFKKPTSTSSSTISPTKTGEASTSGNNLPIIPMGTEDTSARCPFKKPTSTSSSTISPTKTGEASTSGNNLSIIPMGTEDTSARCPFKKPTSTSSSTISPTKTGEASTSGNNLPIIPMGTEDTSARCPFKKPTSTSSSTISPTKTGEASTSGNNLPIIPMGTEDTSARCPFKKPTSTSSSTISPTKTGEASTSGNNLPIIPMGTEDTSARCPFKKPTEESLTQFHIMDETEDQHSSDGESGAGDGISDEKIERMLEEALDNRKRKADDSVDVPFEEHTKVILVEKGKNHFDVLPLDWIQITHDSGMPIYLHKTTRVCTLSRPYFLGPGSARKHDVPLSSVPCLNYIKSIELEEKLQNKNNEAVETTNELTKNMPNVKIETVQENIAMQNLTPDQLKDYCQKLFKFQSVNVLRFKTWSERRKFTKKRRQETQLQRPTLPDGTKLITFPIKILENDDQYSKGEWIMNPKGKSYVCILHEYVQHALKIQPSYVITELENAATPYAVSVKIDDMKYGTGYGTSKKQAKSEAAKWTLEILVPGMISKITADTQSECTKKDKDEDFSFFDEITMEDPRVAEFCAKTAEPAPYDVLLTCLQRNFCLNDLKVNYQGNTSKNQGNQFEMTVGKHTATIACKTKKEGKQRASQAILQKLHPSIMSWGSILRLYGNNSVKSYKEKKLEEREITSLQSKAVANQPNYAILNKLKLEMGKLNEKRKALKPIGVLDTAKDTVDIVD